MAEGGGCRSDLFHFSPQMYINIQLMGIECFNKNIIFQHTK